MGFRNVRVMIVTGDSRFYTALANRLRGMPDIEDIINYSNLTAVASSISRNLFNVIILDADTRYSTNQYLQQLMEKHRLLPILTASSKTACTSLLQGGVREFFQKPASYTDFRFIDFADAIKIRIRMFTDASPQLNYMSQQRTVDNNQPIVAIASSTGGTEALETIFKTLPASTPPILVVQHMPSGFTKFFADRLNMICQMEVREAADNDYLMKGLVLIAPAGRHMSLVRRGSKLAVECFTGSKVNCVMPAADVLFDSIAPVMRNKAVGVILTGMGADGAKGLLKMRMAGAKTISQNKETCVVYGMPKVANDLGAIDFQLPIGKIAEKIMSLTANGT